MTATTEDTRGTALAQVAPGVLASVEPGKTWTVAQLADALAGPAPEIPEAEPFPAPAAPVTCTPKVRKALADLPALLGKVNVSERRMLTPAELEKVTREAVAINAVTTPLGKRSDTISEMIRAHQDIQAEKAGQATPAAVVRGGRIMRAATQRVPSGVARGHYLLAEPEAPFETPVEGFDDRWQQRFISGKASLSLDRLKGLEADGTITRDEYLSFTRETRVIDEEKIAAAIRKNPGRALAIMREITTRSAARASLYPPKK